MKACAWLVAQFCLKLCGVGVGLIDIAGLHREEYFLSRLAVGPLDLADEIHQLDRVRAAYVVNLGRDAASQQNMTAESSEQGILPHTRSILSKSG